MLLHGAAGGQVALLSGLGIPRWGNKESLWDLRPCFQFPPTFCQRLVIYGAGLRAAIARRATGISCLGCWSVLQILLGSQDEAAALFGLTQDPDATCDMKLFPFTPLPARVCNLRWVPNKSNKNKATGRSANRSIH